MQEALKSSVALALAQFNLKQTRSTSSCTSSWTWLQTRQFGRERIRVRTKVFFTGRKKISAPSDKYEISEILGQI
jgi:hypothetical protein